MAKAAALLFDLDGTFADTAPDLGAALNCLRTDLGLVPVPLEQLRPHTSSGVRGMLGAGLDTFPGNPRYTELYARYLRFYADALCVHTTVFPGIDELVQKAEARGTPWGIITNKTQHFTLPLLEQLGYAKRADCIVSGDSSPRAKPAPHPMHLACALIARGPAHCLYVGDDLRDIQAGRAVGMPTAAVRYGYLGCSEPIEDWGADYVVEQPADIAALAGLA
jgi:phosphoglycolate phosphatase